MFGDSLSVINATLKTVAGEPVSYSYSVNPSGYVMSSGIVSLTAIPTNSRFQLVDEVGAIIEEVNARDWLVEYEDLGRFPQIGDSIQASGARYAVSAPDGREIWRWTDSHQTLMRIHTTRTSDS